MRAPSSTAQEGRLGVSARLSKRTLGPKFAHKSRVSATIPTSVLEEVKEELLDWRGRGLSVMEISHRSDFYQEIALEAERDFRDLD